MNFPREYHWKRKTNMPSFANLAKTPTGNLPQPPNLICGKGVVRIEQYEYEEENLLGVGYTSKVYLGHLVEDHRQSYAIKVVDKRKISKDKQSLALLKQQMDIHQQLDHPNIIKCHQIIDKPTHYYFILEYCPQGTLDTFIKKHQKLTENATVTIIEQIISGYKYLMEHKVLHRDLKPPNILKSGPYWKICDFGFSVKGKKNLVGEINVGTPAYMAPQALERTYYSQKTDFFALGVICYEMLFGVTPWQHKNEKALLSLMQQQRINQQLLSSISNEKLAEFIIRCCEIHERKRMNIEQFQSFTFRKKQEGSQTSIKLIQNQSVEFPYRPSSKTINVLREYSIPTTSCPSQNSSFSTARGRKESIEQLFNGNNSVIQRELYICQIMNALIKNYSILNLDDNEKQLYLTVLGKHAGYIIRRIKHTKLNYLCLKRWEEYGQSEQYMKLTSQATEIHERIQSYLKNQTKRKSIVTIRVINKKYDQLTYDKHLTYKCVTSLKEFAVETMNNFIKIHEQKRKQEINKNPQVTQMLQYLSKYYNYVKNISVGSQQSRAIAINNDYKERHNIIEDFNQSNLKSEQFHLLREEVNNIQA